MGKVKGTDFQIEQRVNQVYKLLLNGASRATILQYAANPGGTETNPKPSWELSERQLDEYISRAKKIIKREALAIQKDGMESALAELRQLYYNNMLIKDYKAALATRKEINALLGLYPTTKVDVTSDGKALAAPVIFLPQIQDDSDPAES